MFANNFFLVIAIMQALPDISNTYGIPMMLFPLAIIVGIDMMFAIAEDVARHKADAKANR